MFPWEPFSVFFCPVSALHGDSVSPSEVLLQNQATRSEEWCPTVGAYVCTMYRSPIINRWRSPLTCDLMKHPKETGPPFLLQFLCVHVYIKCTNFIFRIFDVTFLRKGQSGKWKHYLGSTSAGASVQCEQIKKTVANESGYAWSGKIGRFARGIYLCIPCI